MPKGLSLLESEAAVVLEQNFPSSQLILEYDPQAKDALLVTIILVIIDWWQLYFLPFDMAEIDVKLGQAISDERDYCGPQHWFGVRNDFKANLCLGLYRFRYH
jgi:hypothetical protein